MACVCYKYEHSCCHACLLEFGTLTPLVPDAHRLIEFSASRTNYVLTHEWCVPAHAVPPLSWVGVLHLILRFSLPECVI